jgi:hypothetical protein|eukprot:COSAG01_NODE_20112_length_969_cov_1804.234483_1_plen_37_part_00
MECTATDQIEALLLGLYRRMLEVLEYIILAHDEWRV